MQQLRFDNGIQAFKINDSGVLRFNPGDPNLYARFLDAEGKIREIEKNLVTKGEKLEENDGAGFLRILAEADQQIKETLNWVFGKQNNFDEIMGGVNLLAVAGNGERVITNLINALTPLLQEGAKKCVDQQVGDAVQQAQMNRAQRRAKK